MTAVDRQDAADPGELDYQIVKRGGIAIPALLPVCLCLVLVVLLHIHIR